MNKCNNTDTVTVFELDRDLIEIHQAFVNEDPDPQQIRNLHNSFKIKYNKSIKLISKCEGKENLNEVLNANLFDRIDANMTHILNSESTLNSNPKFPKTSFLIIFSTLYRKIEHIKTQGGIEHIKTQGGIEHIKKQGGQRKSRRHKHKKSKKSRRNRRKSTRFFF